jgi:hypothetical protein
MKIHRGFALYSGLICAYYSIDCDIHHQESQEDDNEYKSMFTLLRVKIVAQSGVMLGHRVIFCGAHSFYQSIIALLGLFSLFLINPHL